MKKLIRASSGVAVPEYGILAGLVGAVCLVAILLTGGHIRDVFATAGAELASESDAAPVEEVPDLAEQEGFPEGAMILAFDGSQVDLFVTKGAGEAQVQWGDEWPEQVTATDVVSYSFGTSGRHLVGLIGDITHFESRSDNAVEVLSFGDLPLTSLSKAFEDDVNLTRVPPLPAGVTDISYAFSSTNTAEGADPAGVGAWDVSGVENFSYTFAGNALFNGDVSQWDVGSGSNFEHMFDTAGGFTGDLGLWCVEQVASEPTGFGATFAERQPTWGYCGTPVAEPNPSALMFTVVGDSARISVNVPSSGEGVIYWGDGQVSTASPDANWTASHSYAEAGTYDVQVDLGSGISSFAFMEDTVVSVDQWPAGLTSMSGAFSHMTALASVPALPATVTSLSSAFLGGGNPAGVAEWDVGNVTTMSATFQNNAAFTGDLSGWDVSSVTNMGYMFFNADGMTSDLSGWCVSQIPTEPSVFGADNAAAHPVWGTCP